MSSTSPRDPEEATAAGAPAHAEIPGATRMGAVHLAVSDLRRSLAYYESVLGLSIHERGDGRALLGAGSEDLLVLIEQPGARPSLGYCGLYHFALLLPQRVDLARWLAHAARDRVALVGLSDHFVSEAIYLSDPDGHGIEIYWDRPRELWEGRVAERMTTLPLDTASLFAELAAPLGGPFDPGREPVDPLRVSFDGLPAGTTMGHVHLCVADIPRTIAFYRDVLGFALMASLGGQAAFLSAGGYHHHLGANTWESAGAGQPPEGSAALKQATIVLPSALERDLVVARATAAGYELRYLEDAALVHDPSGNPILLVGR
ncbi:MAG TPA: VOC family protein [Solirubrobacteraceae bacterium]|jgi:catechol 2,3-dioxygenase|nr:VOC family protein [Solirubrobacteraceae bacterium]